MIKFSIEDGSHCECCGVFESFSDALKELEARSKINWDVVPNFPPCGLSTCDRDYVIIERETDDELSKVYNVTPIFSISAKGIDWKNSSDIT